ncbi:hypothetical protein [Bartonella sp. OT172YNZD]|uniref:hypothetical protein n=1 Tax=Bartonella sp. OT172YNZD TaxID=3243572 RepID=UPI0035D03A31
MVNSHKRKPPAAGNGRPKGAANKTTKLLKNAILKAAEQAGNKIGNDGLVSYLEQQAKDNPGPFMNLLGKVLPMQISGEDGGGLHIIVETGVPKHDVSAIDA